MGRPILICLGYGEIGRFSHIEPADTEGFSNVYYYPPGLFGGLKKPLVIHNVPTIVANMEVIHPPSPYAHPDGYKILVAGENGNRWLAERIEMFLNKNWKKIELERRAKEIALRAKSHEIAATDRGKQEALKAIKQGIDILHEGKIKREERRKYEWEDEEI